MRRERIDRRDYADAVKLDAARRMRRNPTAAEGHAWALLRNRGILGLKFRRQHVLHGFIVDFYCAQLRLVLELDGPPHRRLDQSEYDDARSQRLRASGYRVLRLRNQQVSRQQLEQLLRPYSAPPPLPTGRGGRG
jgi:very-short-patch-repair endonuclease